MMIYTVRHTDYLNPDNIFPYHLPVQLSTEGRAHARRIGEWFQKKGVGNIPIFTSPIVRTNETAEIIADALGSTITSDQRLIEVRCPNLQGKKQPETGVVEFEYADPSREPLVDVQKRIVQIFDEKVFDNKDCILVSHGDLLTSLYYHLAGKPLVARLYDSEHISIAMKRGEIMQVTVANPFVIDRYVV